MTTHNSMHAHAPAGATQLSNCEAPLYSLHQNEEVQPYPYYSELPEQGNELVKCKF
jgi:hypothetical protein